MTPPTVRDIPIWLINLPASTERAANMQRQLEALGLPYKRIDAVNGRDAWDDLQPTVDLPAFERNVGRPVLPGEIGCYHSHLRVWQAFAQTDAPVALVLEDDVVFHPEFCDAVDAALGHWADWDVLKLNHIRAKLPVRRLSVGEWDCATYIGAFTGTAAYLVNRDVVAKLLGRFTPITRPIDHELDRSHVHQIRHYGLVPYPSHVADAGQSTITGSNFDGVKKYPRHKRLPSYGNRITNFFGKLTHTLRTGQS